MRFQNHLAVSLAFAVKMWPCCIDAHGSLSGHMQQQQQQQQQQEQQQSSVPSTPVIGPDQIPPADMGVAAPPPGFIPLPEGLPVPASAIPTTSVAQGVGVDTSQPPPLRPPEGGLPAPGLAGIPAGMPGTITGVPPPGAMPMVSPFALPNVPRKLCLILREFYHTLETSAFPGGCSCLHDIPEAAIIATGCCF